MSTMQPQALRAGAKRSRSRGQSLVEFAVSLPILLLILTGIFTFGIAFNNYLMLTDAVGVGGRQLAVSRGNTTDPCTTATTAVFGVAPYLDAGSMKFTIVLSGTTVAGPDAIRPTCSSGSTTTGAAGDLVQGGTAQITVKYPCNLKVFGINYAPSCTVASQVTEVVQ